MDTLRKINHVILVPFMWLAMHFKLFAYRQPFQALRRILLEMSQFFDFLMVFANIQNHAIAINFRLHRRGNFLFGKAVMVVDYKTALEEIPEIKMKGSRFMGVPLVANEPGVFVSNAGPITTSQPARQVLREHMNRSVFSGELMQVDFAKMNETCSDILREWTDADDRVSMWTIRGTATRIVVRLLAGKDISREAANAVTRAYFLRFGEMSLFGYYAPFMLGLLGTRDRIHRDAFKPLQDLGVDNLVIDMVLFAAMFSLGTIIIKCIDNTRQHDIDYVRLDHEQRIRFVIESQRLYPTVTSVHRILEKAEKVVVNGKTLQLYPGEEVAYPFLAINRDPAYFSEPDAFRLDRSDEEVDRVMSWSVGFHACPVKRLSVLITVMQLDALAAHDDLRSLRFFNLEV